MFNGKKIIITGGSSGVEKILAQQLIKKGAHLALIARDEKKLLAVQNEPQNVESEISNFEVFSLSDIRC
ncbi:MAG: SDR family NAD(P)-dependent oxidoreductase [Desulfobacteraceae bacterium]|nr:SDR family NAD(P)-dependent oxidoreductase [Desulfobacteraceae bacterium]